MNQITAGMDTAAGLALAEQMSRAADRLRSLTAQINAGLGASPWQGPDSARMRAYWQSTGRAGLGGAADGLAQAATRMRQEAQAQVEASAGGHTTSGASAAAAVAAPHAESAPVPRMHLSGGAAAPYPLSTSASSDAANDGSAYSTRLSQLPADQRTRVEEMVNRRPEAAWAVRNAVGRGVTGQTLDRYVARVGEMDARQLQALDPERFDGEAAKQPDTTTCGSSTLVMARMINRPDYAMRVLDGFDPTTGQTDDSHSAGDRFHQESLDMHWRTNGWTGRNGELQGAWPMGLGTFPDHLVVEMNSDGGSGKPGLSYDVHTISPLNDWGGQYDLLKDALGDGSPVPVYVGGSASPRHVVLATGTDSSGQVRFYDPSDGSHRVVTREAWDSGHADLGGWNEPWFFVVPTD